MSTRQGYPFYKSLRFRFGVLFGLLFLLFLSAVVAVLYASVSRTLKKSFQSRLETEAQVVLQKTEVAPLIVPLPQKGQYYRLTYRNAGNSELLFSNLPPDFTAHAASRWQYVTASRALETGDEITMLYVLPANELSASIQRIQQLLFICIPLAFLASLSVGYLLSGFLLKPVTTIISKANSTDLQQEIHLLQAPRIEDEFHGLTLALNRMLERISKQAQEQNAFFASASHELRTPLSNMLTQLQVSARMDVSDEVRNLLTGQIDEVQRLSRIVNDFLLMSQLKAAMMPTHSSRVDIAELCLYIIEAEKAPPALIKFTLQPEDEQMEAWGDKSHIQIIIRNLINNAVKYNRPQAIITLSLSRQSDGVCLRVINETNEPVENVALLKSEFTRAGSFREGFGLGLWITTQLCFLNDARLEILAEHALFEAQVLFKSRAT